MYKNVELRKNNLKGLKEKVDKIFNNFIEKTQKQYEDGSLYLFAEVDMDYNFESCNEMCAKEFEILYDTKIKSIIKLLNDRFSEEETFENYSIKDEFRYNQYDEIEKMFLTIRVTLRS